MSFASMQHGVIDSVSSSVRVSGSPVVDMMLATLVSGFLLQYLPTVCQQLSRSLQSLLRLLLSSFFSHRPEQYRHKVEITATSSSKADDSQGYNNGVLQSAFHSPNVQSSDNLPLILGTLHHFQRHHVHFKQSGQQVGHLQPCMQKPTIREQLQHSLLSFIPEQPVLHQEMLFTFRTSSTSQPADQQQDDGGNRDDYDDDGNGGGRQQRKGQAVTVASMGMTVEGNCLESIEAFLSARLKEEVDLAYPKPQEEDQTFLFELNEELSSRPNGAVQYFRSPFNTTKTFKTVFFPQKAQLLRTLQHFEAKTGPWAPEKERPHKLVILLEGLPGTGKSSSIKAIANLTRRHLLCLNPASIRDDAMLTRLFRDETLTFTAGGQYRNEVVRHDRRLIVFEDLDCSGKCDWLMDRTAKAKKAELSSEEEDFPMFVEGPVREKGSKSRSNKHRDLISSSGPTLGGLLNTLDGVSELQGHIVILTTNHADLFDPALLRPGRVDMRLTMGHMQAADLVEMVQHTFDCQLDVGDVRRVTAACGEAKWTASKVQEILQGVDTAEKAVQLLVEAKRGIAPCA